jgi:hypothetical protein
VWNCILRLEKDIEITKVCVQRLSQRQSVSRTINLNSLDQMSGSVIEHIKYRQRCFFRGVLE